MKSLFSPTVALSNKLTFKAKFALLTLICTIPLIVTNISLIRADLKTVESAELEKKAAGFIVPLRQLVEHIAQTRGMTNAFRSGNSQFRPKILEKRQQVQQDFEQLEQINQQLILEFDSTQQISEMQQHWQQLSATAFSAEPARVFIQYSQLIREVINFIDTIARLGHLNQEADPSNIYLINSLISTLPNQAEALGQLRGKGSGVIARGNASLDDKLTISSLADDTYAQYLKKDMEYLFSASPALEKTLGQTYNQVQEQLQQFFTTTEQQILNTEIATISAEQFFTQGTASINRLFDLYDAIIPILEQRMTLRINKAHREILAASASVIIIILLIIYAYVGIYLAIKNNINRLALMADDICDGNLDARLSLSTRDELSGIADSFNRIVEGFSRAIIAVLHASREISTAAEDIAEQSKQAANGMKVQSEEVSSTSSAITQMSASVTEVASNTDNASQFANEVTEEASRGAQVVSDTVAQINLLAEEVNSAVSEMQTLEENSNNINNILDVIRGVSDQTNLLALNAAIEAARAGEQGRGFSVVADEVRTLAQRTQASTVEIQAIIEQIQNGTKKVSRIIDKSKDNAEKSVRQADLAGESLQSISSAVSQISERSVQIATAANQQSTAAEDITQSIVRVADVADSAAANSRSMSATGSRLAAMSEELQLVLNRYELSIDKFSKNNEQLCLVQWSNEYEIGLDESDRQHQKMLDMMNEVHILATQQRKPATIAKAINNLIDYTRVHFEWEENMFERYGYPDADKHHQEHKMLLDDITEKQRQVANAGEKQIDALVSGLYDWLLHHIKHSDVDYVKFVMDKRNQSSLNGAA